MVTVKQRGSGAEFLFGRLGVVKRSASLAAFLGALGASPGCSVSEHEVTPLDAAGDHAGHDATEGGSDVTIGNDGAGPRDVSADGDGPERRDGSTDRDATGSDPSDANADLRGADSPLDAIGQPDSSPDTGTDIGFSDGPAGDHDAVVDAVGDPGRDTMADISVDTIQDVTSDAPNEASFPDRDAPIVVGDDIWAVGRGGVVLHRTNATGWSFETTPPTNGAIFYDVWGTDRSNVWAVGTGDIFHYDGMAWTSTPNPVAQGTLRAVWGSASTDVWAVGYDTAQARGLVLRYNGSSWANTGSPSIFDDQQLVGVWGSGPRDFWVISRAKVFHFGATATWDEVAMPDAGDRSLEAVWTSGPSNGWIMGNVGEVLQLSAGGWSPAATYPETWFQAVSGLSANDVWAVAWTGPLLTENKLFRNTGSGWIDGPASSLGLMNDVFVRSPQDVWFVGWTGVIGHYDGSTVTADPTVPTQEILEAVWGPR